VTLDPWSESGGSQESWISVLEIATASILAGAVGGKAKSTSVGSEGSESISSSQFATALIETF
jgi:hypothetical protein